MTYTIKLRRGLPSDWTAANPVLAEGEFGYELGARNAKIGDGTTPWNSLPYFLDENDRLPDATLEPDGQILLTFGGAWTVAALPSGLPDPTGVPDQYMIATVDEEWVVQPIPSSPDELPNPAGQADGAALVILDEEWVVGAPSGGGASILLGHINGVLVVGTGQTRFYNDTGADLTITSVRVTVVTSPTGGPATFDFNLNGTSIFSTSPKPSIPAGQNTTGAVVPDDMIWAAGEYLTFDVDLVGTTYAGSVATIQIGVG